MKKYRLILLNILFLSYAFTQDPCTCENDFNPVCGTDGFTYPNECMATCFGVSTDYFGECTPQIQCNPGEFLDPFSNECFTCSEGTYSMGGTVFECDQCLPGTVSNGILECDDNPGMMGCGADGCDECPPGTYSYDGMYCMTCPEGTYSMGGAYDCMSCDPGTVSNGYLECDDNPGMMGCGGDGCDECPPGTYSPDGYYECMTCPEGTYSMGGAYDCMSCDPGTVSNGYLECDDNPGMIGCGGDGCNECPPGTYSTDGMYCMTCPYGTYSMGGTHECVACPPNLMSNGIYECDDMPGMMECGGDSCVDCAGNPWGNAYLEWNDDLGFEECVDIDNITGCTYAAAYNFTNDALIDDGSCTFPCPGDFNQDNEKNILDIIILVDEIMNYASCPE